MALDYCRLLDEECDAADRKFTYKATYEAKSPSRTTCSRRVLIEALSATPDAIPAWMASYALLGESDPNAFAQKFKCKRRSVDDSGSLWRIDVDWFASDGDPDDDQTSDEDPALRPVRIDGDEEEVQEICEEGWNEEPLTGIGRAADVFGPIENASGKEPGSPLTKARRLPVLVFTKNFVDAGTSALAQIMTLADTYVDKLNNATFYGAPAGKAIVRSIRPSEVMFAGNKKYREATIRVCFNEKGWSFPMVNRGYEYLNESGDLILARKKDETGKWQLVSEPINLELDGTRTPDGSTGTIINWRTSDKVSFTGLGVGTS